MTNKAELQPKSKEGKLSSTGFQFSTPAHQIDFPNDPVQQQAMNEQWNTNLNGFTQQGITGNPWNMSNSAVVTNYFNPITTSPIQSKIIVAPITWSAFPGRIGYYFPNLTETEQLSLADTGYMPDGKASFPNISKDPCSGQPIHKVFGPFGPRGWQDEYCEWAVTRNANNKITRIDFTCENPEYWNTLWMVNPNTVLNLYQSTLNKPQIQLTDLYLYDQKGNTVIDASTGNPAYNPLNKWNLGAFSTSATGGAMHLTSTPNTLQTKIRLATSATMQRTCGNTDFNTLMCCAQFGQPHRNSDLNIGGNVNQIVSEGLTVTLTNPPGLYIQLPDFSLYKTPDGTDASTFWTIIRGKETLQDESGNTLPGNFILHASFEVPDEYGYTVSDITVKNKNGAATLIDWAGQIAQTFNMQIVATAFPTPAPVALSCAIPLTDAKSKAQPEQLFHKAIFEAMSSQNIPNPVQQHMTLISNSTLIAPIVEQKSASVSMVLTCTTVNANPLNSATWPSVTFDGNGDIKVSITKIVPITYTVPGNSYPSESTALYLNVMIAAGAQTGLRNIYVTNFGQEQSVAMQALLNVVPVGTISFKY